MANECKWSIFKVTSTTWIISVNYCKHMRNSPKQTLLLVDSHTWQAQFLNLLELWHHDEATHFCCFNPIWHKHAIGASTQIKVLLFLSLNSPDLAVRLATYQFLQLVKHSCLCGNKNHIGTGRLPAKKLRLLKDVLLKRSVLCLVLIRVIGKS